MFDIAYKLANFMVIKIRYPKTVRVGLSFVLIINDFENDFSFPFYVVDEWLINNTQVPKANK